MAQRLGNFEPVVELAEPVVDILAETVVDVLAKADPLKEVDVLTEEDLLCFEMKEDPQMYSTRRPECLCTQPPFKGALKLPSLLFLVCKGQMPLSKFVLLATTLELSIFILCMSCL